MQRNVSFSELSGLLEAFVGPVYNEGNYRNTCLKSRFESSCLEFVHFAAFASCPFREHHDAVSMFKLLRSGIHAFGRLPGIASSDEYQMQAPHPDVSQRNF